MGDNLLAEKDKEPELSGLQWYAEVFKELDSCRSTVSLSPIPFTAIAEFARIYSVEDFDDFLYIVRQMDDAYLDFQGKKNGN